MRSLIIAIFLTTFAICAACQTLEDLSAAVVYLENKTIEMKKVDNTEYEIYLKKPDEAQYFPSYQINYGSGFFVGSGESLYLVTAKHVAEQMSLGSTATFKTKDDRPVTLPLSHLTGGSKNFGWLKSEKADVAVLPLHPPNDTILLLKAHFLPKEILEKELVPPSREKTLVVLGFPLGIGVKEYFSPISKEVKAANGLLTIAGKTYFLLDSPSIGGYSGAPIFLRPGGNFEGGAMVLSSKLQCLGILTATISDETGGKLATVVPAAYICDLLP